MARTCRPADSSSRAVPPVETTSTPRSASPRAKSTIPRLSDTDSRARLMRTAPGSVSRSRASVEECSEMDGSIVGAPRVRPPDRGNTPASQEVSTTMQQRTGTDPEHDLERTGDELEERIERIDDEIGEAQQEAKARSEDPDPFENAAGDSEETDDDAGGEDPEAFDDPESDEEVDEDDDF